MAGPVVNDPGALAAMAGLSAVYSVGNSIVRYLQDVYPQPGDPLPPGERALPACQFQLVSSGQLTEFSPQGTTVTLYLFRLGIDRYLRNTAARETPGDPSSRPLTLELHYLLSIWADGAEAEQRVMAWVMQQLHARPILDRSMLTTEGRWEPGDEVHVVPSEISHEDMMRVWDALDPAYRLSVSYAARVVRIARDPQVAGRPVVATRYDYQPMPEDAHAGA